MIPNLGDRLRAARELAKLTQADLAAQVGISRSQIANLEVGNSDPSLNALLRIAQVTGTPVGALIGETSMPELPRVRVVATSVVTCDRCGDLATIDRYDRALDKANEHRRSHMQGGAP